MSFDSLSEQLMREGVLTPQDYLSVRSLIKIFIKDFIIKTFTAKLWPSDAKKLHRAIAESNIEKVRQLIEKKPVLVNIVSEGWDPQTPIFTAIYHNTPDILAFLLAEGADHKIKKRESTALAIAAMHVHPACVRLLLKYGASVDEHTSDNWTPLQAIGYDMQRHGRNQDNTACAKLLLAHGADRGVCKKDENGEKIGKTAEEMCPKLTEIIQELKLEEYYEVIAKRYNFFKGDKKEIDEEKLHAWLSAPEEKKIIIIMLSRARSVSPASSFSKLPQEIINQIHHEWSPSALSRHAF